MTRIYTSLTKDYVIDSDGVQYTLKKITEVMNEDGSPKLDGDPIYEGHILTDEGNNWQDSWIYGEVYYDEDERDWFVDWKSEGHVHPLASEPYRTIAGNIYEKKELFGGVEEK